MLLLLKEEGFKGIASSEDVVGKGGDDQGDEPDGTASRKDHDERLKLTNNNDDNDDDLIFLRRVVKGLTCNFIFFILFRIP